MQPHKKPPIRNTVRMILLDTANRILLLLHISPKGSMDPRNPILEPFWIPPGGGVESGETQHQALRRELKEETGISEATIVEPAAWYGEITLEQNGMPVLFKQYFYLVRVAPCKVTLKDIGTEEQKLVLGIKWWTLPELQSSQELFLPRCLQTSLEPIISAAPQETQTVDLS